MAFEDVQEAVDKYWNPKEIGDNVEGNVYKIDKDQWNNDRIVLDLGDDENGNMMSTTLPAHAQLQRFVPNLGIGDYIRVTLVELKAPSKEQLEKDPDRKPTNIYKVQKDHERAIDYGE